MDSTPLLLGCAKVDITPQKPLALAGFAHRKGFYERIEKPLYARILFFRRRGDAAGGTLFVSADLLWWGDELVAALKERLRERYGLSDEHIVFHGTHSHSGPQTGSGFTPSLGSPDKEYVAYLADAVMEAAARAASAMEEVYPEIGGGSCRLGVYRRKMVDGLIRMAPNPAVPVDPEVTVLRYVASGNRTKGVLVHYACHPTTSGDNVLSSEYPGFAMDAVEEHVGGGAVAAFVQGCCADVRPALVRDGDFYRGGIEDVKRLGGMLAEEVQAVLGRPMRRLAAGSLAARTQAVELPLQEPPSAERLRAWASAAEPSAGAKAEAGAPQAAEAAVPAGATREAADAASAAGAGALKQLAPDADVMAAWSRGLLAAGEPLRRSVRLELSRLELAEGVSLLAANAELAGDYGRFMKSELDGTVLGACYSNGMIGYVATAGQLAEGGYEAIDYIYYFGLPAPLAPEAEGLIHEGIRAVAG